MCFYICVYHCRWATVDKQLWGGLGYKDDPEITPKTVVRVQLIMSEVMYMYVYVGVILVLMRLSSIEP